MSYRLNKTDGSILVDLIDGQIDTSTTNLTFIGKNYRGFGEFINENFIKLLENFSNTSAPENPITGQLWYDTSTSSIKVYDGQTFKSTSSPTVGTSLLASPGTGDLFFDQIKNQLFIYTGTEWLLIGPLYERAQGYTGLKSTTVLDNTGVNRVILELYIQDSLVGVYSSIQFTPNTAITGIASPVKIGFTPVNSSFNYNGTATNAQFLLATDGTPKTVNSFLPADANGLTTGSLTIQNNNGLTLGTTQNLVQKIVGSTVTNELNVVDSDYKIRIKSSADGGVLSDAIVIDTSTKNIGLFQSSPQYDLDLNGSLRVTGDLIVEGTNTNIDVSVLRIEDKNIELAINSDSTLLTDSEVNDAGIIIRATGDDKTLLWKNATQSWTSSENFDIVSGKTYKIGGTDILSETTLASSVTSALGLTELGTLTSLDVDDVTINGSTISSTTSLTLNPTTHISVSNSVIKNVSAPVDGTDAANKSYVDTSIDDQTVILTFDITGLSDANIATYLENIVSASSKSEGALAKISTILYGSVSITGIDVGSSASISYVNVDSNGVQNQSVVEDISFSPASGSATISITRGLKEFIVSSGSWTFNRNLNPLTGAEI